MAWWISRDEEHLFGPHYTREEAVEAGKTDFDGEPFYVTQGERFKGRSDIFDADLVGDMFDDRNEEYAGEENPSEAWSHEQKVELEGILNGAFADWLERHKLNGMWAIDAAPGEWIDPRKEAA